jgi:protein gp37
MAENSKIEWTDHTFNPWTGCTKVSPGCDHCYAEGWAKRSGAVKWGAGEPRRRTSEANWKLPYKWNARAEAEGRRYRVFCASLADVFDNAAPDEWRSDLFAMIRATPNLDWLLLTKRIGNAARMLDDCGGHYWESNTKPKETLPNVWIGATIANRDELLRDAAKLKAVPARVRFWSVEPMLGNLGEIPRELMPDWVIVGGESGPKARPMRPDWARGLRDQCAATGVPFLFKQWGEWSGPGFSFPDGRPEQARPDDDAIFKVGKKAAGRLLDGVTHDGYPA